MTSSDEDIDPELREGINNIMKLRDEYDKLEGALRKLGVDPESVVNAEDDDAFGDDDEDDQMEDRRRKRKSGTRQEDIGPESINLEDLDPLSLQNRNERLRRHLDILEEVDESLLSSDPGGDDATLPLPPPPSYPWVQMALPGGGIVSVPLTETSSLGGVAGAAGSIGGARAASPDSAPGANQHANLPSASGGVLPQSGEELLTVAAGEPVTHFNLDQLLEIVQSFQLDTTLAGNDGNTVQQQLNLALGKEAGGEAQKDRFRDHIRSDGKSCDTLLRGASDSTAVSHDLLGSESEQAGNNSSDTQLRETHSCPSSPTETDCSSGFSTLRRRSVTLTEKVRTNKDGSKTQVVREYGCNTSSGKEVASNVTYEQNSFILINGDKMVDSPPITDCLVSAATGVSSSNHTFPSLMPITAISPLCSSSLSHGGGGVTGSGLGILSSHYVAAPSHATLPRVSTSSVSTQLIGSAALGSVGSSSARNQGLSNSCSSFRSHIVRLNSIEPRTVMFNTKDYPIISDISVPEIIDELEKQFEDKLCDLQGVRLVASNVYICLSRKESLQHLTTYGFYARGVHIKVVDITNDSVVVCLTGVPHYISDATITTLVSTFGIAIGEVERRFYKGVDTGERFVRLKPRAHTQVPDFVTVGGCKILIRVLNQDEVLQPFTLQSAASSENNPEDSLTAAPVPSTSVPGLCSAGGTSFPFSAKSRVKPVHCNGNVNASSPTSDSLMTCFTPMTSASRTEILPTGVTGLYSTPAVDPSVDRLLFSPADRKKSKSENNNNSGGDNVSPSSLPASPKIGKSLRSRLSAGFMKSNRSCSADTQHSRAEKSEPKIIEQVTVSPDEPDRSNTYVAGDPLDIPTLSPPPYKAPGSSGGSTSSIVTGSASNGMNLHEQKSNPLLRSVNGDSKAPQLRQGREGKKYSPSGFGKGDNGSMPTKTDSSNSLGSSLAGKSTEALRDGGNNIKRSSVNFDEEKNGGTNNKKDSSKASDRNQATNKTVNGILRKGSGPGDDIVQDPPRRAKKSKDHHRHKSKPRSSSKLESVTESGHEADKEEKTSSATKEENNKKQTLASKESKTSNAPSNSRSRSSSSTKSNKEKAKEEKEKAQKDLALTRDLPWCGCWGNGCL